MNTDKRKVGAGFGVMLIKQGRILLGKRHSDPNKSDFELHGEGTWTMPGGNLNLENPLKTGRNESFLKKQGFD